MRARGLYTAEPENPKLTGKVVWYNRLMGIDEGRLAEPMLERV